MDAAAPALTAAYAEQPAAIAEKPAAAGESVIYSIKTIVELKVLCRTRSIPVTGSKAELIKRLEDSDAGIAPQARKRKSTGDASGAASASASSPPPPPPRSPARLRTRRC